MTLMLLHLHGCLRLHNCMVLHGGLHVWLVLLQGLSLLMLLQTWVWLHMMQVLLMRIQRMQSLWLKLLLEGSLHLLLGPPWWNSLCWRCFWLESEALESCLCCRP